MAWPRDAAYHISFLGTQPTFDAGSAEAPVLDDGGARAVARGADRRRNAAAAAADGEEVETMLRHFTPRRGLGHGRDGRACVPCQSMERPAVRGSRERRTVRD